MLILFWFIVKDFWELVLFSLIYGYKCELKFDLLFKKIILIKYLKYIFYII